MAQIHILYRAFKAYRLHTDADAVCVKRRKEIVSKRDKGDLLKATHARCKISEDWIEKIEWGLPYIEKAIAEERQFIKNDGEVLNIEKIKRVSKDSVSHLAKHSEFLTGEQEENEDIVPEKIYMVERMSDYSVYENRFLYMLLCYLRDFIALRIKKIKDSGNSYTLKLDYNRNLDSVSGKTKFSVALDESCKNDPYTDFDEQTLSLLNRIESAQHVVLSLLNKPLMTVVSKSPMIKPPITKTNVLKMDLKFKNAVELYEYISAYQGDGFKIEQSTNEIKLFDGDFGDELAELSGLASFLSYEYGNKVTDKLKRYYDNEELERKGEERGKRDIELKKLKTKLEKGKITPEEYIVRLEESLNELRDENRGLKEVRSRHEQLLDRFDIVKKENETLGETVSELDAEIKADKAQIKALNQRYEKDMTDAEYKRKSDLKEQADSYEKKLSEKEAEYFAQMEELKQAESKRYEALSEKTDAVMIEKRIAEATLHALRREHGIEDVVNVDGKENFERLEKEFAAYYDFFVEKWEEAKKKLRKEYVFTKAKKLRDKV